MQRPAPKSAMGVASMLDSGNDLKIKIKLINNPKIDGVCATAWPTSMMVVTLATDCGVLAMPSQLAPAASPPP